MFGYSHFTGGFAGGQAEYVRVPNGDVNLLKIPNDVPDEKGESSRYVTNIFDEANHTSQHSTSLTSLPLLTTASLTLVSRRVMSLPSGVLVLSVRCVRTSL